MSIVRDLPPFAGFLQQTPVIPNIYWNIYSSEQRWKEICRWLGALSDYAEKLNVNIGINTEDIAALEAAFEKFQESGFADYYERQIEAWIKANFATIMQKLLGIGIYFGLTSDGYFCAYVPDSWGDIQFDTGAVYGTDNYGRLILRYDVAGGQGVINNDYDQQAIQHIIGEALSTAAGNGLAYNEADGTLSVPLGSNLRYTADGIDAPEADAVNFGVVKISHKITNDSTDGVAASPDAVYAFAQPRS